MRTSVATRREPIIGPLKQSLARLLISMFRTYLCYAPVPFGARAFWHRIGIPYLSWRRYDFVARTRFGSKIMGNTGDGLQRDICCFGVWEPHLTYLIQRRLAPGDVFVDIGANIGYFSLLASAVVGETGKVIAIEASPATFGLLLRNLDCNNAKNVRPLNLAASDKEELLQLFRGPEGHNDWATVVEVWADQHASVSDCQIRAMPLSSILLAEEVKTARLIKIDVEGAEWQVVSGMKPLLPHFRDDLEIAMEVTPSALAACGKTYDDLVAIFTPFGFKPYEIEYGYSIENFTKRIRKCLLKRLREPPTQQIGLLLSRVDVECLHV